MDVLYNFEQQSIEIDAIEHIRQSATLKDGKLLEYRYEDLRTLHGVLEYGLKSSNNGPCLGHRVNGEGPYIWITYSEVIERTKNIGSGLVHLGVEPVNTNNIGIYSKNRPEWTIAEYSCYAYSLTTVPLYDTYGKDSVKFILNQAEISTVFLDTFKRLENIIQNITDLPYLRFIIHFDQFDKDEIEKLGIPTNIQLIHWEKLIEIGKNYPQQAVPPKPSDNFTICYTSGTTGNPKGVILTHANVIATDAAIHERLHKPHLKLPGANVVDPLPIHISYLPLSHVFERQVHVKTLMDGGQIGYISGDVKTLLSDCQELKPTIIPMVPRLLNRMYDRVMGDIGNSKIKSYLLKKAIAAKTNERKKGIIRQNSIYDYLIFNKIRKSLGGRILRSLCGSAPVTKEVMEFGQAVLNCSLPECYGLTEVTSGLTLTHPYDVQLGHCGPPLNCHFVKLVDVQEMSYFANDNKGEICAKGPAINKGYYKDPEKTSEAIDKDGWFHTGDIGMWLPNGCLKVIDRKKNVFKLSQGEYISPEKIENVYSISQFVEQIFVDGISSKNYVVAVVVPKEEYLISYCEKLNIHGTFKELCQNKDVRDIIMKDLNEIVQKSDLSSLEKIKRIHLHDEVFSIENNLLTPTLKYKRLALREYFKNIVQKLYDEE